MIRNGWRVFGGGVVAFGGLRLFVECKDGGNKAESVGGGAGGTPRTPAENRNKLGGKMANLLGNGYFFQGPIINAKDAECLKAVEVRSRAPIEVTRGRFHLWLNDEYAKYNFTTAAQRQNHCDQSWQGVVKTIETQLREYAKPYFEHHGFGDKFNVTQLQLLVSRPGSENQFFHVDNTAASLTFVVALDDVAMDHGPTEILEGSYRLHDKHGQSRVFDYFFRNSVKVRHKPVHATLQLGEMFCFDSRTLHRGGANRHPDADRPVLII